MPIVRSTFSPPWWARNGHVQTILPVLFRRRIQIAFEPETLELPDGDFLELAWRRTGRRRLAILQHGLESNTEAGYIRGMTRALERGGWDVLAWCFRGCGAAPNRLSRSYHSGETGDLAAVVEHAARRYGEVALIGFSLGGNVTLKYLGEGRVHPAVRAGVAISAPIDLAASAAVLDTRGWNKVYLRRFLTTLIRKMELKARHFPNEVDASGIRRIRTFREFDDRYTAPLHGFRDAADYWARASSRQFLPAIPVPTLLLNARNDPMLAPECFPDAEAESHRWLHLEAPASGGHVGFLDFRHRLEPWTERRVVSFLEAAAED